MKDSFRQMLRVLWLDSYKQLRMFWAILILVDILLIISKIYGLPLLRNDSDNFFSPNYGAIAIFTLVSGIVTATVTFPLMLSFGSTRKNVLVSNLVYGVVSSAGMALFQSLIIYAGTAVLEMAGSPTNETLLPFGTLWYSQAASYLLIFILFTFLGMVFYRFGTLPGLVTIAVYLLVLYGMGFFSEGQSIWTVLSDSLTTLQVGHSLIAGSLLGTLLLWLITRRAPVRTY